MKIDLLVTWSLSAAFVALSAGYAMATGVVY
jgi:hypothetical protein